MARDSAVRASLLLWSGAILIGGFALVTQRWTDAARLVIAGMLAVAVLSLLNRLRLGAHVPGWLNHVDAVAGISLTSLAIRFDGSQVGEFTVLYVLIGLFVAFYMSRAAAIVYGSLIAGAYATVLLLVVSSNPDALGYWVALVVAVAVSESIVLGLVAQLRLLAASDPLTGLPNRGAWDDRLAAEIARSSRLGVRVSVAILDLNGFKEINDCEGHLAGDRVLVALADRWRTMDTPAHAFFARLGGDEFGLLVRDVEAPVLEAVTESLAETLPARVSVSVGAARWDGTEDVASLIRRADHQMYAVKEAQRSLAPELRRGAPGGRCAALSHTHG